MQALPPSARSKTPVRWRVVCQKRNGTSYLHLLNLSLDDTGSTAMTKLQTHYRRVKTKSPYMWWDKDGIFWTPVIEVTVLSEHSTTDLEAQRGSRDILVSDRRRDPELTASFHNPKLLSDSDCFVARNERFAVGSGFSELQRGREAIFIGRELRWLGICALILSGTILCVGVGVAVGVSTNSVDLGISVMSGLATLFTCVEAFAFWVYK